MPGPLLHSGAKSEPCGGRAPKRTAARGGASARWSVVRAARRSVPPSPLPRDGECESAAEARVTQLPPLEPAPEQRECSSETGADPISTRRRRNFCDFFASLARAFTGTPGGFDAQRVAREPRRGRLEDCSANRRSRPNRPGGRRLSVARAHAAVGPAETRPPRRGAPVIPAQFHRHARRVNR